MNGYDRIKSLAHETGSAIPNLLALARQNDPFFAGAPAQQQQAEWFESLWEVYGLSHGTHLRRVHYLLVSQEQPVIRHDGKPYENTKNSWSYLCGAAKQARYVGLVDAEAFEDHRNPPPEVHWREIWEPDPVPAHVFEEDMDSWGLPGIDARLGGCSALSIPQPETLGYGYERDRDQPYHLEVWCEKSTMNDVLLPACRRYSATLVTSLGFQSITSVIDLLRRIERIGKPARIFYISDFDPAGDGMPVGVARQVEYWRQKFAPDSDIRLTPMALTRQQVLEYRLPTIPIKDSDRRKENFEARYGQGAVELDALEALHPGALKRLLNDAFSEYFDDELQQALWDADIEARARLEAEWQAVQDAYQEELGQLKAEYREVCDQFKPDLEALKEKLDEALAPLRERLDGVRQAMQQEMDDFSPILPARPESSIDPESEHDEWLYDSGREYMEQLAVYRGRKGTP
jgi:hypothetical protein